MACFEECVSVASTAEAAFEFLLRPANAVLISPPDVTMKIIDAPERFELGSRFEFHLGGFGPVQHVIYEITHLSSPNQFTETQRKGPLSEWVHEHIFMPDDSGGVLITDRITFEPPDGMLGFLLTEERILDSLKTGFGHRHQKIKELLEQPNG